MRALLLCVCTIGLATGPTTFAAASDPRAIVEQAIEAQGGAEQVGKLLKPWRAKIKGSKDKLQITGEICHQSATQGRIETKLEINGQQVHVVVVSNGNQVWQQINGQTREVTGDALAEMQDGGYRSRRVRFLLPLITDPEFRLSPLSDQEVNGRPATGIRVMSEGHRDVDVYFDIESHLLVKTESRILDPTGKELVLGQVFSDYKDFGGLKFATKFTKTENGKLHSVEEFTELTFVERIDAQEFAKP